MVTQGRLDRPDVAALPVTQTSLRRRLPVQQCRGLEPAAWALQCTETEQLNWRTTSFSNEKSPRDPSEYTMQVPGSSESGHTSLPPSLTRLPLRTPR
eukprot:1323612-Prymnesium_polylepis.1